MNLQMKGKAVAKKINRNKQIFEYECTMTGEQFKTTRRAPNPDDLISVKAYYDMNPEKDDRPERIKREVDQTQE